MEVFMQFYINTIEQTVDDGKYSEVRITLICTSLL